MKKIYIFYCLINLNILLLHTELILNPIYLLIIYDKP